MDTPRFDSFEAFYPYYLAEHSNPTCRRLHYIGSSLVLAILAYALISQQWLWLLAMPLAGYGFAWIGHFIFEITGKSSKIDQFVAVVKPLGLIEVARRTRCTAEQVSRRQRFLQKVPRHAERQPRRPCRTDDEIVGIDRNQAKWAGEKIRAALGDQPIPVEGHRTWLCQLQESQRVRRDDEAVRSDGSPLFYGVDNYALPITLPIPTPA